MDATSERVATIESSLRNQRRHIHDTTKREHLVGKGAALGRRPAAELPNAPDLDYTTNRRVRVRIELTTY
jgi:hypothetical protein